MRSRTFAEALDASYIGAYNAGQMGTEKELMRFWRESPMYWSRLIRRGGLRSGRSWLSGGMGKAFVLMGLAKAGD